MANLLEQIAKLAELRKQATPAPWFDNVENLTKGEWAHVFGPSSQTHTECLHWPNAAFIAAAGSLDFAALLAALSAPTATASTLGEPELVELGRLAALATPAPWSTLADTPPLAYLLWRAGEENKGGDFGALDSEHDARLVVALRNALPALLARTAHPAPTVAARGAAETGGAGPTGVLDETERFQIQCRLKGDEFWHNMSGGEKATLAEAQSRIQGVGAVWVKHEYRILALREVTTLAPQAPAAPTEATSHREEVPGA